MASVLNLLFTLALIVANGLMIVFVVIFGKIYCNYNYAFSFSLALFGSIFFYITFLYKHRKLNPFVPVHNHKRAETMGALHRQSFFNGLVWSANYVCLLSANPFVAGLYQVVINESNLVMVFAASMIFLGNRYNRFQWFCFLVVLVGGFLPLLEASSSDAPIKMQWFFLYLLGAWAIGFANTITENVMRNHYVRTGQADEDKLFLIPATQYLCLTNVYGIICVLALFWISWMANGDKFLTYWGNGISCLWTGNCNAEDNAQCHNAKDFSEDVKQVVGLSSMWISATLSFISALIAAQIQREKDVVYVTIAYTLAPVLSMVLFLIKVAGLYDPPTTLAVVANLITLTGGIAYKAVSHYGKSKPPAVTCIVKGFKFEPDGELSTCQPDLAQDAKKNVAGTGLLAEI